MNKRTQTYVRVMTITHAEFLRSLSPLETRHSYKLDSHNSIIHITDGIRKVKIKLRPENVKQMGSLQIPVTEVEFTFTEFSPPELNEFWRLFDLSIRRGGG